MTRKLLLLLLLIVPSLLLLTGCPSEECRQMQDCCEAVADLEWVGDSCGALAEKTTDPKTCQTVTQTIRHSFQSRGETVPKGCQ